MDDVLASGAAPASSPSLSHLPTHQEITGDRRCIHNPLHPQHHLALIFPIQPISSLGSRRVGSHCVTEKSHLLRKAWNVCAVRLAGDHIRRTQVPKCAGNRMALRRDGREATVDLSLAVAICWPFSVRLGTLPGAGCDHPNIPPSPHSPIWVPPAARWHVIKYSEAGP